MAIQDKGLTPMMKQFFSMKAKHPDALMLFRCGDFYETYGEDAVVAAGILGITLTKRNNSAENSIEMAVSELPSVISWKIPRKNAKRLKAKKDFRKPIRW